MLLILANVPVACCFPILPLLIFIDILFIHSDIQNVEWFKFSNAVSNAAIFL